MGFWIFMLVNNLVLPVLMLVFGRVFQTKPPAEINSFWIPNENVQPESRYMGVRAFVFWKAVAADGIWYAAADRDQYAVFIWQGSQDGRDCRRSGCARADFIAAAVCWTDRTKAAGKV